MDASESAGVTRRGFLAGGLLVGAAGLLLPACSAASKSTKQQAVRKGGTLHVIQTADIAPASLLSQNNPNFSVCRTVFNTLTEYDHKTLQPKPALATRWDVKDGGKTYVLTLRDDVKYHSGRPFGPDDVVAVIEHLKSPDVASQTKGVAAVCDASKTGANQVTLTFASPLTNVFDLFEMMLMVDHESLPDLAAGKAFVGTGPFTMKSYRPGSGFSLARNAQYWKSGQPYLDGVEMSVVTQSSSALAALQSGQAQMAIDLAPLDASGLKSNSAFELVLSDANDSVFYIGQNVTVTPLDKQDVRRAIAYAIDRDRILSQVLGGIGRTTSLPWAASSPAYDAKKAATYSLDAAKAKSMIEAAGASGAEVKIFFNAGLATNAAIAQVVQYDLTQVGLKATAAPLQAADFQTQLTGSGLPGLFINGHGFGQMHPSTLVNGAFPFNAAKNAEHYVDADYSNMAATVATATGSDAKTVYDSVNDKLIAEQFVTDLVASNHTYAISTKLQGLAYSMLDYVNLDEAFLAS